MAKKRPGSGSPLPPDLERRISWAREHQEHHLYLDGAGLTEVPEEVFSLENLVSISLAGNQLRTIPDRLWELPRLQDVTVIQNPLERLPHRPGLKIDGLMYRKFVSDLDVSKIGLLIDPESDNQDASFWTSQETALAALPELTLGKWSVTIGDEHAPPGPVIRSLIAMLPGMRSLRSLALTGFALGKVPDEIARLEIATLSLVALGLKELPGWLATLPLERLVVVDNKISSLPKAFTALKNLTRLDLSWNPLGTIPDPVFDLRSLKNLQVRGCDLSEVPPAILRLPALEVLAVTDNSVSVPPQEITSRGLDAIRDYWRQREQTGIDYLCEAKLIILGEPGAGKTSLAHKITNHKYKLKPAEKSTEGIDVIRYSFPAAVRTRQDGEEKILQRTFQVNIWDFGGQEIYHATHQFFLTRRSVYVLVCDDRKEDTDFAYWLQVVEMLSDGSPLLIVQNEKQNRTRDINISSLRARFANIRRVLSTNLETNRGLSAVVDAIRRELEVLPHVGAELPATWKSVREALEKDTRDYVGLDEYLRICEKHGFTRRDDALQVSGYLHDLGICLHFQDDPLLKNTIVLKPSWATDAVYRVLDDEMVVTARGRFTADDLERIWAEPKYRGMHHELVRLMMKFQLCYALEGERTYIAPQLLASDQPPYAWDPRGGLSLRYEYVFMPKGIITRLIVATHHLIADGKSVVWRTGVVLERDSARAEIVEEYAYRRIRVRVTGPNSAGLLAIVDDQLQQLHASFPRLQYDRFLPCPCSECSAKAEPYAFSLERLAAMARKGQQIQCHASGEMVDAATLIREVLPGALRSDDRTIIGSAMPVAAVVAPTPEVFVSYAWTPESTAIVDRLQAALADRGIRLLRDREEVRYKDSIREFMRRLGKGKAIVVVVSEKYLKSENCMFEMLEIAKAEGLRERIFPIILPDANIFRATGRVRYIRYWEEESSELDEALKAVRGDNLLKIQEDRNLYSEIRRLFDRIAHTLRDMNALTPENHEASNFQELIDRVLAQVAP